jgi:hypothetical protein
MRRGAADIRFSSNSTVSESTARALAALGMLSSWRI